MPTKILSIDDCEEFQDYLCEYFAREDCELITRPHANTIIQDVDTHNPDIILLDLLMPGKDGLSVLRELQDKRPHIPIIMLSGRGSEVDRIIGIETGADDYLAKPFEPRELSARIKAILRLKEKMALQNSPQNNQKDDIRLDGWTLDRQQFQIFDENGNSGDLTTGEFLVLERLALAPNQALSREQLFELMHKHNHDACDRAVDIQITRIRRKMDDTPKNPKYIKTIRNIGYMFIGKINT